MQEKLAEARAIYEELLAIRRRVFGPEHPDTLATMRELAVLYAKADRSEEALDFIEQALAATPVE